MDSQQRDCCINKGGWRQLQTDPPPRQQIGQHHQRIASLQKYMKSMSRRNKKDAWTKFITLPLSPKSPPPKLTPIESSFLDYMKNTFDIEMNTKPSALRNAIIQLLFNKATNRKLGFLKGKVQEMISFLDESMLENKDRQTARMKKNYNLAIFSIRLAQNLIDFFEVFKQRRCCLLSALQGSGLYYGKASKKIKGMILNLTRKSNRQSK